MKNILISSSAAPDTGSGISTYSKELAISIKNMNIDVHYFSPKPNDLNWLKKNQIKHIPSDPFGDPVKICRDLFFYIKKHNIDAVINNDNPYLQSIFPTIKCPAISIGHMNKRTIPKVACYANQWTDYVVTISNDMHYIYVNKYKTPITKTQIIHNGINDHNHDIKYNQIDNNKLNILYSGGDLKIKGADLLVKSITKYPEIWGKTNIHWYGNVSNKIIKKLKKHNVNFHGRVPREKLIEKLKNSDVFLLPSRLEGCPMTLIEAMAYGIAPITSNGQGAMRWMVNSGEDGYICHIDDWAKQAAECVEHLNNNKHILLSMKKKSRHSYLLRFKAEFVAEKILNLLKNPTVNRDNPLSKIKAIKWHRPRSPSFFDRIYWRLEILKRTDYFDIIRGHID